MQPTAAWRPRAHLILLVVAVLCFAVFTLLALGTFHGNKPDAWLGAGLTAFALSFL